MLTETGRVVGVEHDSLWVETIRQSTCARCSAQKGCGHGLLNRMGSGGRASYLRVPLGDHASAGFRVDDRIRMGMPERVILRGSFVVYLLPLLCALLGTALASGAVSGDVAAIAGAVGGFLLGLGLVRRHARRHRDDGELQPRLLGRVHPAGFAGGAHQA